LTAVVVFGVEAEHATREFPTHVTRVVWIAIVSDITALVG
jgi:hypothetical protein